MLADGCRFSCVSQLDFIATFIITCLWIISPFQVDGMCHATECLEKDMEITSNVCQVRARDIIVAEHRQNKTQVCQAVHELFVCVGENVPQCLGLVSENYQPYMLTPWVCEFTDTQLVTIQKLSNEGCTGTGATINSDPEPGTDAQPPHHEPSDNGGLMAVTSTEGYKVKDAEHSSDLPQDSPKSEHTRTGDTGNDTSASYSHHIHKSANICSMMVIPIIVKVLR